MSIKTRVAKLEKIHAGSSRFFNNPLIIKIADEAEFTPEGIALLEAGDRRMMEGNSPLLILPWDRKRLSELQQR
jgi:hypothetical protein